MSLIFLLAAAVATPSVPPIDSVDYGRLIDDAIDGGRLIQAETMLGQWRAAPGAEDAQPLDIATAQLALAKGENGEAEARFAAISSAGVTDCRVDEGLGVARLRLNRAQEALRPLRRAVDNCGQRWRAWSALGVAYDDAKSWAQAAAAYEEAFQLTDRPAQVLNNYGLSLMAQGQAEKAAVIFDKAREMAPGDARIVANGDAAHVTAGHDIQRRAGEDADGWAKRLSDAGEVALRIGDTMRARAYLSQAVTESEKFMPEASATLAAMGAVKP